MKDYRLRVSLDAAYETALGRAAFCFASLEWNVVWCCEKMKQGYINGLDKKTAGRIAGDFRKHGLEQTPDKWRVLSPIAAEFDRLVVVRNELFHGKPGTAPNGDQRLFHQGQEWTIDRVNEAADEFTACSIPANDALDNLL
jgi:hypothetical protein